VHRSLVTWCVIWTSTLAESVDLPVPRVILPIQSSAALCNLLANVLTVAGHRLVDFRLLPSGTYSLSHADGPLCKSMLTIKSHAKMPCLVQRRCCHHSEVLWGRTEGGRRRVLSRSNVRNGEDGERDLVISVTPGRPQKWSF